ncbi:hypothetical protein FZEAL_5014 [Fusarium zealandicum]|uniref:Amine oxidase domain-containing protein n=1 Tax=Fusarium zealandicum TaxID=1053134 RepID=A0A8H4UL88_9HYPO|nr:hypothetical protein FZEAL_5014 [Fusarium zealandicum]
MNEQHAVPRRERVAVIGTGLAGLTTAYLLQSDQDGRYAVTLFEQADRLSFDSASVTIRNDKTDVVERIDLPMRASAGGYYGHLLRMYRHLRIPLHPIRFLFVFAKASSPTTIDGTNAQDRPQRDDTIAQESYFVHASNLHQMPPPWPGNRGVLRHILEILYLTVCQFWFTIACLLVCPLQTQETSESFADYIQRIRLPRRYASHYLLPLLSSVSTCSHDELLAFPASDIVDYKKLSHGQQHYTVCGGVSQVQSRLTEGLKDVRLNSRVIEVVPGLDGTTTAVRWQPMVDGSAGVSEQTFDRIVLAVSPDVAGRIFRPLRSTLERLPTRLVESSVLKPEELGGQPVVSVTSDGLVQAGACAHHVADTSPPQTITLRTLFPQTGSGQTEALHTMPSGVVVSTCPLQEPADPEATLKKAKFTRTLRNTESKALIQKITGGSRASYKARDDDVSTWVNGQDNVCISVASVMPVVRYRVWATPNHNLQPVISAIASSVISVNAISRPLRASPNLEMEGSQGQSSFTGGFMWGIAFTLAVVAVVSITILRKSDIYGLGHWKLNIRSPPQSMWMNVGYWKNSQGEPIQDFQDACTALLRQIVGLSGILDEISSETGSRRSLAILDLGFGCGDQTWELARLSQSHSFDNFRYVGLTLNNAQVQTARQKIYREIASAGADAGGIAAESFSLFCANAAKPETWSPQVADAVYSLADENFTERWLLALDCLYHFSPSRKPVFEHAARELDAQFMAFDLLINESASSMDILKARLIGKMMGCPLGAFLTEKEYRDQLVECGYDRKLITIKEITDHVFSGLVKFLNRQDQLLGEYGVSLGGYKLAGRLFDWFDRSRVVRAVVVVARTKSKTG